MNSPVVLTNKFHKCNLITLQHTHTLIRSLYL